MQCFLVERHVCMFTAYTETSSHSGNIALVPGDPHPISGKMLHFLRSYNRGRRADFRYPISDPDTKLIPLNQTSKISAGI